MQKVMRPLPASFFRRQADTVARALLGQLLVHRNKGRLLVGRIVETEAYFGHKDPASRAYKGKKNMNRWMWSAPSTVFVYPVHNHWMLNAITGRKGDPQGVLIRAVEPLAGIGLMKRRRKTGDLYNLCSGPGKLTRAFQIKRSHGGSRFSDDSNSLMITKCDHVNDHAVGRSHRIGVTKDLSEPLRFYVRENRFVSRYRS